MQNFEIKKIISFRIVLKIKNKNCSAFKITCYPIALASLFANLFTLYLFIYPLGG